MIVNIEFIDDFQKLTLSGFLYRIVFFANFQAIFSALLIQTLFCLISSKISGPSSEICLFLNTKKSTKKEPHEEALVLRTRHRQLSEANTSTKWVYSKSTCRFEKSAGIHAQQARKSRGGHKASDTGNRQKLQPLPLGTGSLTESEAGELKIAPPKRPASR